MASFLVSKQQTYSPSLVSSDPSGRIKANQASNRLATTQIEVKPVMRYSLFPSDFVLVIVFVVSSRLFPADT